MSQLLSFQELNLSMMNEVLATMKESSKGAVGLDPWVRIVSISEVGLEPKALTRTTYVWYSRPQERFLRVNSDRCHPICQFNISNETSFQQLSSLYLFTFPLSIGHLVTDHDGSDWSHSITNHLPSQSNGGGWSLDHVDHWRVRRNWKDHHQL